MGLDVGMTSGGVIVWAVFATADRYTAYVDATTDASIALGLGANVLDGGSNGSLALQPVSVAGEVGFDVGAGTHAAARPRNCRGRRRAIPNRCRAMSRLLTSPGDA